MLRGTGLVRTQTGQLMVRQITDVYERENWASHLELNGAVFGRVYSDPTHQR